MSSSRLRNRNLDRDDHSFLRVFKFVELSENQKVQQLKQKQENFVRPTNVNDHMILEYLQSMQARAASVHQEELDEEKFTSKTDELRQFIASTLKVAGKQGDRDPMEVWESIDNMNKGIDAIATMDIDPDEYAMWADENKRMKEYYQKHPVKPLAKLSK